MNTRPATLGHLMRSLRLRNGWTLKKMSIRIGIPISTLGKVEHDLLTLGYDKLLQISQRLGIGVSELFAVPRDDSESRETARRSVGTLRTAVRVESRNYEYFFLCPDLRRKRMHPTVIRLRARTLGEFGELVRHAGEEFIFVLSGRVEVHTEFYQPILLDVGECVYIDSNMGHAYLLGAGCDEASVIGGCSSIDDGLLSSLAKPLQLNNSPDFSGRSSNPPRAGANAASARKKSAQR